MKEGLAALTKFVKVVMAYRPDPDKNKREKLSPKPAAARPKARRANKGRSLRND